LGGLGRQGILKSAKEKMRRKLRSEKVEKADCESIEGLGIVGLG